MKIHAHLLRLLLLLSTVIWLSACSPPAPAASPSPTPAAPAAPAHPRPVIIDTDMAQDDWMAILYSLQRPDLAVKSITVSGTGEAHCQPGIKNALGLVALAGSAPIPVACGRETPLAGNHTFPEAWRQGVDRLMGLSLPAGQNPQPGKTAVELLKQTLTDSPEPVTVLTLGPLTNLAELLQANPALSQKINTVYIMGGAVHVPGNLGTPANTVAEWNLYVDPHAAALVFQSGVPLTLVALDATNHVPATTQFLKSLEKQQATPVAKFVYRILNGMRGSLASGSYYFWDPTAAAVLADETLAAIEPEHVCVVEEEGPNSGQTRVDDGCPQVRVAISVKAARFEQVFLDTLNLP